MRTLLPLLSSLLLLASCGKDTPKPTAEPELLGRWNAESVTAYNYNATGQLLSQNKVPDRTFYLLLTRDSIYYRDVRDGNSWGKYAYTRQGNSLQYGRSRITITELTNHALTLRFHDPNQMPAAPYQEIEDHYSR